MDRRWVLLLALPLLFAVCEQQRPGANRPDPVPVVIPDEDPLGPKVAALMPSPAEDRWRKIAWRSDLLAARIEARELGKPIFLWAMDGHPLGLV